MPGRLYRRMDRQMDRRSGGRMPDEGVARWTNGRTAGQTTGQIRQSARDVSSRSVPVSVSSPARGRVTCTTRSADCSSACRAASIIVDTVPSPFPSATRITSLIAALKSAVFFCGRGPWALFHDDDGHAGAAFVTCGSVGGGGDGLCRREGALAIFVFGVAVF